MDGNSQALYFNTTPVSHSFIDVTPCDLDLIKLLYMFAFVGVM